MSMLTRLAFLNFFAGAAGMAVRAPAPVSGGSGLNGPANNLVGSGHPLNLKGVGVVNQLPPRIKLSTNVITVHYPPSNAELQQEIDNLTKQINALQQNETVLWVRGDELYKYSEELEGIIGATNKALANHWHDYDDGIGFHSTSGARM